MLYNIIVATIPAAVVGFLFKDQIDAYLFDINNISYLSVSYLFLSGVLFFTRNNISNNRNDILLKYAFIIGLAQCFAIIPGISRAGITIATALYIGIDSENSTRFSFILAIPILFVSFFGSLVENYSLFTVSMMFWPLILGFLSSFVVGNLTIEFLINIIKKNTIIYLFLLY
jgi:undecaprenyl-diphosphatase